MPVRIIPSLPLSAELEGDQALDEGGGQAVEADDKEDGEEENDKEGDDVPLVVLPDDVLERLEGVEEPEEGRVRATAADSMHSVTARKNS